ncbi:unnamed protein product [Closterium sp. NIES-53]
MGRAFTSSCGAKRTEPAGRERGGEYALEEIRYAAFTADGSHVAVATSAGFKIFRCADLAQPVVSHLGVGPIKIVELTLVAPRGATPLVAFVGTGDTPHLSPRELHLASVAHPTSSPPPFSTPPSSASASHSPLTHHPDTLTHTHALPSSTSSFTPLAALSFLTVVIAVRLNHSRLATASRSHLSPGLWPGGFAAPPPRPSLPSLLSRASLTSSSPSASSDQRNLLSFDLISLQAFGQVSLLLPVLHSLLSMPQSLSFQCLSLSPFNASVSLLACLPLLFLLIASTHAAASRSHLSTRLWPGEPVEVHQKPPPPPSPPPPSPPPPPPPAHRIKALCCQSISFRSGPLARHSAPSRPHFSPSLWPGEPAAAPLPASVPRLPCLLLLFHLIGSRHSAYSGPHFSPSLWPGEQVSAAVPALAHAPLPAPAAVCWAHDGPLTAIAHTPARNTLTPAFPSLPVLSPSPLSQIKAHDGPIAAVEITSLLPTLPSPTRQNEPNLQGDGEGGGGGEEGGEGGEGGNDEGGRGGGGWELLASASAKGTVIRVHCIRTGNKLFSFRRGAHPASIFSISFSPPGSLPRSLALTSSTGTAHIFHLPLPSSSASSHSSSHSSPRSSHSYHSNFSSSSSSSSFSDQFGSSTGRRHSDVTVHHVTVAGEER